MKILFSRIIIICTLILISLYTAGIAGLLLLLNWETLMPFENVKEKCVQATMNQPFIGQTYYAEYFRKCLKENGPRKQDRDYITPPDIPIEELG